QVDVGDRKDSTLTKYTIGLYAGGNLLAQDDSSLTPNDGWLTSTVTYLAGAADPFLGQALEIRIAFKTGGGIQTNFDNVRLDGTPQEPFTVPEPASLALAGFGVGALAILSRRRARPGS